MSEQRIELYATANDGFIRAHYRDRDLAMRMRHPDEQIIRLVEIRDGEPHPDDVGMMLADAKLRSDAATERAEKAEAEVKRLTIDDQRYVSVKTLEETRAAYDAVCRAAVKRADQAEATVMARDVEIDTLRSILKQFEDGGMSGREAREAKADERARFERECAAKLIGQNRYDWNNDNRVYTIETKTAIDEARKLADHYFGAKEV